MWKQTRKRGSPESDGGDEPAVAKANSDDESEGASNITRNKRTRRGGAAEVASSAGQRRSKRNTRATKSSRTEKSPCEKDPPNTPLNTMAMNDEVTKVKTAKTCAQRWDALFMARDSRKTLINSSTTESNDNRDAFDCSDLIIPPTYELVNREVERGIERWKDLATRVIIEEDEPTTATAGKNAEDDGDEVAPLRNHELILDATIRGDKRKQRLLPYNFDYTCKTKPSDGSASKEDRSDGHHCPKVISLLDPTKTLDYEEELWHVFKSVKTADELERIHALGDAKMDSDTADGDDGDDDNPVDNVAYGCQHTLGVKENLKKWLAKYSRMDAHSLGRLRIRDRHCDPLGGAPYQSYTINNDVRNAGVDNSNHEGMDNRTDHSQTTIRFEILRHSQELKRASGPDSNRMEVELHGSQHTLLDLHRLLVECAVNTGSYTKGSEDGDIICAGVFFIENAFYTCGEVGDRVGEEIQQWLDSKEPGSVKGKSKKEEEPLPENKARSEATITPRRHFLGLSPCKDLIPMSKMNLEDLPLRLGVRYFHMFVPPPTPLHMRPDNLWSLANESAVYVTGIHTHSNASLGNDRYEEKQPMKTKAPIIIHDTWAPPQRYFCLACNYSLATVVTVNDPLTDATPPVLDRDSNKVHLEGVPMCSACYQALHYQPNNQRAGENGAQSLLELRSSHQPSLVFPVEDYQRMTTASSLDEIPKNAAF